MPDVCRPDKQVGIVIRVTIAIINMVQLWLILLHYHNYCYYCLYCNFSHITQLTRKLVVSRFLLSAHPSASDDTAGASAYFEGP